jgi:hypothetical protein
MLVQLVGGALQMKEVAGGVLERIAGARPVGEFMASARDFRSCGIYGSYSRI